MFIIQVNEAFFDEEWDDWCPSVCRYLTHKACWSPIFKNKPKCFQKNEVKQKNVIAES